MDFSKEKIDIIMEYAINTGTTSLDVRHLFEIFKAMSFDKLDNDTLKNLLYTNMNIDESFGMITYLYHTNDYNKTLLKILLERYSMLVTKEPQAFVHMHRRGIQQVNREQNRNLSMNDKINELIFFNNSFNTRMETVIDLFSYNKNSYRTAVSDKDFLLNFHLLMLFNYLFGKKFIEKIFKEELFKFNSSKDDLEVSLDFTGIRLHSDNFERIENLLKNTINKFFVEDEGEIYKKKVLSNECKEYLKDRKKFVYKVLKCKKESKNNIDSYIFTFIMKMNYKKIDKIFYLFDNDLLYTDGYEEYSETMDKYMESLNLI